MRRRGVVLLVSLFTATMIIMLISAASILQMGRGNQVQHFSEQDGLLAACESGYQYAQAQLQKNPAWRGEGNATIVSSPTLSVVEDRGNVYGLMTDRAGNRSQFRIRFNFHNGTSLPQEDTTGSNRDDPTNSNLRPKMPYVSLNNLTKSTAATFYRAEKVGSVWRVDPSTPHPTYTVPRSTCVLYVEGLAGDGLRSTTLTNPEPLPNAGRVLRMVTESYITRPVLSSADSAVFGASGINATVADGGTVKVEALGGSTAKIRSLSGVVVNSTLSSANYQTSGDVIVAPGNDFVKNGTSSTAPAAKMETAAQQSKKWLKLKWSQVKQADPAGPSVRAGTYVWRDAPRRLEYYNQEYDGSTIPTGSPSMTFDDTTADSMLLAGSGSGSLALTGANMKLRILHDVTVEPQGGVTGFAVVSDPTFTNKRPMTLFAQPTGATTGPTLTNQTGNVYLGSSLDGKGAVTAGGNLTFQGASFFETSSLQSVAIYSKGDINMLPVPPAVAAALPAPPSPGQSHDHDDDHHHDDDGGGPAPQDILNGLPLPFGAPQATDVAFGGIIFAMGNFNADLAGGNLYIRGSLAAYGGNPDSQQPGEVAGSGKINTNTNNAHFVFDPAYFGQSQNLTTPGPLTRTLWAVAP